jgi:hypothetical protein
MKTQPLQRQTVSDALWITLNRLMKMELLFPYPYSHTKESLLSKLIDFSYADDHFNPECLRGKYWDLIKIDIHKSVINFG